MSPFGGRKKDKEGRGGIFDHAALKLLALIFAVALWYLVVGEKSSEVGLMAQLALKGMPKEMIVTKTPRLDVEVRVAGPGGFLDSLSPSDVEVALDLGGAKPGVNTYRLEASNVNAPKGIRVLTIRPSSVDITLERLAKKVLAVKVKTRGVPAKGYKVKGVSVEPASVEVFGKKRVMGRFKVVSTETLDISGAKADIVESIHLDLSKKGLAGAEPDSVTVRVDIEKKAP
ncbi:hypothetical protein MNBD_DELTA01-750 [hydrothermal vent metagenome]|uniref:YbbR-like domain-containing protein n=1 Tax=hydrothermal vent metagenome TaxID=652676 RepID=A0A3B0QV18_9ZZZZ